MFRYEKFNASNIVSAPPVERVVEFSPSAPDAGDVARVLSLAVDGKAVSAGRVNFRLVYQTRDGAVKGVDYNADFSLKAEGGFLADDNPSAEVSVVEADVDVADAVTLSAVVSVRALAVRSTEEECLVDAEKCYKTVEERVFPCPVAAKTTSFSVSEEADAGDIDEVLLVDAQAVVTSATASEGIIAVEGRVRAAVTFTEDGDIRTRDMLIPFREEIPADGVAEGDEVSAVAWVRSSKVVLAGVPGANIIRFEGDIAVRSNAVRMRTEEVIADMFMLTNEVELGREHKRFTFFGGMKYSSEKVSGAAPLEDRAPAESVVAVPYARCYAAKAEAVEGGALVEGVPKDPSLVSEDYMEDRLAVICPADGPFRQGETITLEQFRAQRFLLREKGSGTREEFDRVTEQAGFSVTPAWEAMSTTALVNAVIEGLGVSVLPQRLTVGAVERGLVVTANVEGFDFCRQFRIIYHKDKYLSPVAKAFLEHCRNFEQNYPLPRFNGLY